MAKSRFEYDTDKYEPPLTSPCLEGPDGSMGRSQPALDGEIGSDGLGILPEDSNTSTPFNISRGRGGR